MRLMFWGRQTVPGADDSGERESGSQAGGGRRRFLKLFLTAAGGAGVAQLAGTAPAGATYTDNTGTGNPDSVDRDLAVQGNLTVQNNLGIGTTSPQGKLDVNGAIYISGTQAVGSDGVIKKCYYAQ